MDPIQAIFSALIADAGLAALLDEFDGEPAIFSGDVVPQGYLPSAKPYVWIRPPHAESNFDTFTTFAHAPELDISFYALALESSSDLDEAARVAREILHRQLLPAPSGEREPMCTVSGPFGAPTSDPSIAGRRLSARVFLRG